MKLHSSERAFSVSCSWVKQDCRVSGHLSSRGRSGHPDTPEHWETEDDTPVAWTHSLSVTKLEEETMVSDPVWPSWSSSFGMVWYSNGSFVSS
ncbi:hypothetical protein JZ751_025721 [Albula glossodonta]|uniref:Uncharacterized protein n=1 Tax=Albula glossodonta TaxID=121402 RepID=A0A8T2NQ49_9TELE|nr:hypothetical protein JZ751_025721 [Albula glossodonta]